MSRLNLTKVFIGKEPFKDSSSFAKTLFFINIYNFDLANEMFLETSKYYIDKYTSSSVSEKWEISHISGNSRGVYGRFWFVEELYADEKRRKVYYFFRKDLKTPYGWLLGLRYEKPEGKEVFHNFLNILTPLERSRVLIFLEE